MVVPRHLFSGLLGFVIAWATVVGIVDPAAAEGTGTIEGTVTSPLQCGPVPGATVLFVADSTADGVASEAVTDAAGWFSMTDEPVGTGKLSAADSGFVADRSVQIVPGINRVDLRLEASRSAPYWLVDCPSFDDSAGELARTGVPLDALVPLGLVVFGVGIVVTAIASAARSEGLEPQPSDP